MTRRVEGNLPFRWDVRRDQLGSLLEGVSRPDLWFASDLTVCAARIVARSGDGDLCFVGRSLDSAFDLLSGALSETTWSGRLVQLPFSMFSDKAGELARNDAEQLRANLASLGISPADLTRGRRPLVFVDLVAHGRTFTNLYLILRAWIDEERVQWDVARTKLRFVGVTLRQKTSPKTWRWQQAVPWASDLPAGAIKNISLAPAVWRHLGNDQPKITQSHTVRRWSADWLETPPRDAVARSALAEAFELFEFGRSRNGRTALARAMSREHAFREPWIRSLALELRR